MSVLSLLKGKKSDESEPEGLLGVVKQHLDNKKVEYMQDQRGTTDIHFSVTCENVSLNSYFSAVPERECLIYYVRLPNVAPEGRRQEVLEYLSRVNFNNILGGFIMNVDSGSIFYKISVDVEDGKLSTAMVNTMMSAALHTVDHYYPGLVSVMYSHAIPSVVIREAEAQL